MKKFAVIGIVLLVAGFFALKGATQTSVPTKTSSTAADASATAIFAGGCFWCVEADFEKLPGVIKAESGYIGGHVANPSYDQVSAGITGHAEAVRITYNPAKVSYQQLLDHFWRNIDPTEKDGQFCDLGPQYRTGIYYLDEAQRTAAEASKIAIERSGVLLHVQPIVRVDRKSYPAEFQLEAIRNAEKEASHSAKNLKPGTIFTEILPATIFYLAEEYHQDYYKKNPVRYRFYRTQCGRDARLAHVWRK
jgi:peptide-methionine (S)-S-oxide reductase